MGEDSVILESLKIALNEILLILKDPDDSRAKEMIKQRALTMRQFLGSGKLGNPEVLDIKITINRREMSFNEEEISA